MHLLSLLVKNIEAEGMQIRLLHEYSSTVSIF